MFILADAAGARAQPEGPFGFNLPAEPLAEALRDVGIRTGSNVIAPDDLVRARQAPALAGMFTAEEAVARLLAGTGLRYRRVGGTLVVERGGLADGPVPSEEPASAREVVVTGTRIRGAGSTSPVIVTTRRALEESGVSDLAGFARVLPQNFTGGQNPGVAGGGEQAGQSNINNSATLNLRGLGADATLTLIDGHRVAYDALDQGIDISAIPLDAVDRIEVIADGASALYGSDAVGGVANIILRRDYDGIETSTRVGASTDGGDFQHELSTVGGKRWQSGGFMAALDYSRATPIHADQRDYTRNLDPSLTLTLRNAQLSAVLSGHQQLTGGVALELDGYAMQRRSHKQSPFLPDADVFTFGLTTDPELKSYAVTPTIRAQLPGGWQAAFSATRAVSSTRIDTSQWTDGTAFRSRLIYRNSLSGVETTAEGPIVNLPGGAARLAVGGGLRQVALHVNVSDFIAGAKVPFQVFTERRNVEFAYGELSLPLAGPDQRLPAIRRLMLSAALRYERWNGIDKDATPKLGIIYDPNGDATIRATWGKSFKVPTLNQVNEVVQGVLFPGFFFSPQPEPPLPPGATVLLLGGGNPNLRAERATSWSTSFELHPRAIDGLHLTTSFFDVDFRDRITSPIDDLLSALPNPIYRDLIIFNPTVEQVDALIATLPQGLSNQTGQPFDPSSVAAIIDSSLRNTAREHVRGLDAEGEYRILLGSADRLMVTAAATYLKSDLQLTPSQPRIPRVGTIFNPPHWRGRGGLIWQGRRGDVAAMLNYVGATRDTRFPDAAPVGPFVTVDLSAGIRSGAGSGLLRGTELRFSVLNLFDEEPDVIRNSQAAAPSYDSTNQSPVGRFVAFSLRKHW